MSTDAQGADEGYRSGLRALLVQMAPPYGFTLATFTASGMMAYFTGGAPDPWEILLLLAGAFTGYAIMVAATASLVRRVTPRPIPLHGWQMVHIVPLGVVFLVELAVGELMSGRVTWFVGGIVLTLGYLGTLALVLRFLRRRDQPMLGPG